MAINYSQLFNRRATPQSQKIPGSRQAPNSSGGYSWELDDWAKLETGLQVMVPQFIEAGTRIKVDTRDDSYLERA